MCETVARRFPKMNTGPLYRVVTDLARSHRLRDGGAGGSCPPPIRAVCRHEFEQRVDIIRAKHNTCLNNTNLGSVTAVNGGKNRI